MAAENDDGGGNDLAKQFDARTQVEAIIETAEQREHRRSDQEISVADIERNHDDRGHEHADCHRDAADTRDRRGVNLAFARMIDDAPLVRKLAKYRQPGHRDDHRQQEGHDVQHRGKC